MRPSRRHLLIAAIAAVSLSFLAAVGTTTNVEDRARPERGTDADILQHARKALDEGKKTFRFDTFGDEAFWGDTLKLHKAIPGAANGGVGDGLTPNEALAVGLKVDVGRASGLAQERSAARAGESRRSGDDAGPSAAECRRRRDGLLRRQRGRPCGRSGSSAPSATPRSTTRSRPGSGAGSTAGPIVIWTSVQIINLAPDLSVVNDLLGVPDETTRAVVTSWGPGKFDAELFLDGSRPRVADAHSAGLRPRGREPSHLDRMGLGHALERLRREPRDAREGPLLGSAPERREPVSDRRRERLRESQPGSEPRGRPHHAEARGPALLPARDSGAGASARQFRRRGCERRRRAFLREGEVQSAVTSSPSAPSPAGTCTRRRRSASTTSRRTALPIAAIAPRRSEACGRTRRAASTTTGASRPCSTWSSTTTRPSSSA